MASNDHSDANLQHLVFALYLIAAYGLFFVLLHRLLPNPLSWLGVPQLYFLVAALWMQRRQGLSWRELGWRKETLLGDLVCAALLCLVPLLVVIGVGLWMPGSQWHAIWPQSLQQPQFLYHLFVLIVAAPFCEEFFFRGILTPLLRKRMSPIPTILIVAFLFSAAHFQPQPGPFLLGVATSAAMLLRRSMLPGLLLHLFTNALGPSLYFWWPEVYARLQLFFL